MISMDEVGVIKPLDKSDEPCLSPSVHVPRGPSGQPFPFPYLSSTTSKNSWKLGKQAPVQLGKLGSLFRLHK